MSKNRVPPSIPYREGLLERLKDKEYAAGYLNAVIEDSRGEKDALKRFLIALRDVAEAQGNISALAKRSRLSRENIYRILSDKGNPQWTSVTALLDGLGFNININ